MRLSNSESHSWGPLHSFSFMNNVSETPEFATIISTDRWAHALTLHTSLERTHPNESLTVVVIDEGTIPPAAAERNLRIVRASSLNDPRIHAMRTRYSNLEFACALKPFVIRHLLFRSPVFYLDSDIFVYNALTEAFNEISEAAVLLTPHRTSIIPDDGYTPSQASLIATGIFNAGFIAMRDHPQSWKFLKNWEDHCYKFCVDDRESGLFLDQKWLDIAPVLITNLAIIRHPGYNVGYWNADERLHLIERTKSRKNASEELRFIHFSGFDPEDTTRLTMNGDRLWHVHTPYLLALASDYGDMLLKFTRLNTPI